LDERELGDWGQFVRISLNLARAIRRMHAAGVAHSDLSFNNVLIDPLTGSAIVIDLDGLIVQSFFPPQVAGTKGFIAPEVVKTQHLRQGDPAKVVPSKLTDLHALAVMIYQYLFTRHPLEGGARYSDTDVESQDRLEFGEKALFIEHPTDSTNRVNPKWLGKHDTLWGDPSKTPMSLAGPYLTKLFLRAFVDGLHNPQLRPSAEEWETALIKTNDLLHKCSNSKCTMKWFVYDENTTQCPECSQLELI
jgi:DNA-binding helix-hairpin-helix protein with protein kinase domain